MSKNWETFISVVNQVVSIVFDSNSAKMGDNFEGFGPEATINFSSVWHDACMPLNDKFVLCLLTSLFYNNLVGKIRKCWVIVFL